MSNVATQLPPAVDPSTSAPYNDLLRRILLILQIIETKAKIVHLLLLIALTLVALLGV